MAEGKYEDKSGIAELQARLRELQRENLEIKQSLKEIANANLLPGIVQNGFENVIAQLRPLRDLTPQRESVDQEIADAVAAMLEAMEGVKLTGNSLGIPAATVPFIGEPPPDVSNTPGSGGAPRPHPGRPDPYTTLGKPTHQIPGG